MGTGVPGSTCRRKFSARTVSPRYVTFFPASASRSTSTYSSMRLTFPSNSRPIHCPTMAGEDVPIPRTNRPPESCWIPAALIAVSAGGRVNTGTSAVPSRTRSVRTAIAASGANASVAPTSAVHTSV